jgi:hypothetical protein
MGMSRQTNGRRGNQWHYRRIMSLSLNSMEFHAFGGDSHDIFELGDR